MSRFLVEEKKIQLWHNHLAFSRRLNAIGRLWLLKTVKSTDDLQVQFKINFKIIIKNNSE